MSFNVQLFIIFVVAGVLLIGAEIFAPGAVLGIMGSISLVAAVITGFAAFGPAGGAYALVGIIILVVIGIIIWMKYFPASRVGQKIIVSQDLAASKAAEASLKNLVGKEGETISELRPAGFATLDGRRIDVVTQGEMISKGKRVRVVQVEGNRVVVELKEK
jgi:membrane-bound serine protease (ClpP class)